MEEDKKEEHDVKAQKRVLDETIQMLPNTKTRLEAAVADLTELIVNYDKLKRQADIPAESPAKTSADYKAAEDLLTEVSNYLKKP